MFHEVISSFPIIENKYFRHARGFYELGNFRPVCTLRIRYGKDGQDDGGEHSGSLDCIRPNYCGHPTFASVEVNYG